MAKIESTFMSATDYSPAVKSVITKKERVFELRTYVTAPDRLKNLHARFRDHTCGIFEAHGMKNIAYWTPMDEKKGKANTDLHHFPLEHTASEEELERFHWRPGMEKGPSRLSQGRQDSRQGSAQGFPKGG